MNHFKGDRMQNLIEETHPQWGAMLSEALKNMNPQYLQSLKADKDWLPGEPNLFAAFNVPLSSTRYLLLGESPYPRSHSANGYAFWDNSVQQLWSEKGLSKEVNRATSLRNLIKMLLYARGDLTDDFSQEAIARVNKKAFVQTGRELFESLLDKGFLLLNASLVYSDKKVPYHAKEWRPFMHSLLTQLAKNNPSLQLILFGKIAHQIPEVGLFPHLIAEHPYNISFIKNKNVVEFFKPMDVLHK